MADQYSVSYGGVPIHLEEPSYELHLWLERALSIPGDDLFAGAPLGVLPTEATWGCPIDSTLERTNWPKNQAPLLNSLQWPVTGATRFARSIWLFSGDNWDTISATLDKTNPHQTLKFFEGQSDKWAGTREVEMYALRPRRVQTVDLEDPVLWIVPLVDIRYLWQFRPVKITCDEDTTWSDLLGQVNSELRTSVIYRGDVSGFGNPDPRTWNNRVEPASILLDAIAGSLGRRFVATTEGDHSIVTADIAGVDSSSWPAPENERPKLSGGDNDHSGFIYPEKLWVVFPPYESSTPTNNAPRVVERSLSTWADGTFWTDTGSAHLVRSTFYADIDPENPDDPALNLADLKAIADEIGYAIVGWLALEYEYSFHGHAEHWIGCGFDDTITIEFGTLNPIAAETRLMPGNYRARTRIKSLPPNCLPTMNYSQEPGKALNECPCGGEGEGTLYGFSLNKDLSYSDPCTQGAITERWLGPELTESEAADVRLYNPMAQIDNSYIFMGTEGRKGLCIEAEATWRGLDDDCTPEAPVPRAYTIIQMECTEDEAGESGKVKIDINGELRYLENQWLNLVTVPTYNPSLHTLISFENDQSDQLIAFIDTGSGTDEHVSVDGNDTAGYLINKLQTFPVTQTSPISVYFKDEGTYVTAYFEEGDLPANTDEKVKINVGDTAGSEYLEDKFDDVDTYNPTTHQLVYFTSLTDTLRAFTAKPPADRLVASDPSDGSPGVLNAKIANPSTYDSETHQLVYQELSGATVQLFTSKFSGEDLDEKVQTTSSDPSAGYLDAKFAPGGTYSGSMILVQWDQSTSSLMRGFIDPADLPEDSDKFVMVSATDSGGSAYLEDQVTPKGSPVVDAITVSFHSDKNVISAWFDPDDLPVSEDRLVAVDTGGADSGGTLDAKLSPFGSPGSGALAVTFQNNGSTVGAFVQESELPPDSDKYVAVRAGDTPNYLEDQLSPIDAEPSGSITVHFDSNGSVITAWIDKSDIPGYTDIFVAVSSADSGGYLEDQLTPSGSPILGASTVTFNTQSAGTLVGAWTDSIVKTHSTDNSPGYLDSKFWPGGTWSGLMITVQWDVSGSNMIAFIDPDIFPGKVKVTAIDTLDYLSDQFTPVGAAPSGSGALDVKFSDGSGLIMSGGVDIKDLPGYTGSGKEVLISDNGTIAWQAVVKKDVVRHVDFIFGTGFVYYMAEVEVISETDDATAVPWEPGGPCPPEGI